HETNDINDGNIERTTKFPDVDKFEMIFSGPHFFVSNPLYKTPKAICTEKAHYDVIDLTAVNENFISRTNYKPINVSAGYASTIPGFEIDTDDSGKAIYDNWLD